MPGVLLTQLATLDLLADEGLDLTRIAPVASVGHSQGIIGVAAFAGRRDERRRQRRRADGRSPASSAPQPRSSAAAPASCRTARTPPCSPSAAPTSPRSASSWPRSPRTATPPRSPRSTAPVGSSSAAPPAALRRLRTAIEKRTAAEAAEIEAKSRGGRAFAPTVESMPVALGFHHPALAPAVEMARDWAEACGLDAGLTEHLAHAICVETVDWPRELADAVGPQTRWVVDLGPADLSANMTGRALRGRGVTVIPAATAKGRDLLFTTGASVPEAADWSAYAPRLIDRGDGKPVVDTAFTRLTGKSPILLAGMTPTTVDPEIVAAAANAGHWAELAGGGQVTEEIFAEQHGPARPTSSTRAAPPSSTRSSSTPTCGSCRSAASASCRRPGSPVLRSTAW